MNQSETTLELGPEVVRDVLELVSRVRRGLRCKAFRNERQGFTLLWREYFGRPLTPDEADVAAQALAAFSTGGNLPAEPNPRLLVGEAELAEQLGVCKRHILALRAHRQIPFIRVGGRVLYDPAEVVEWFRKTTDR